MSVNVHKDTTIGFKNLSELQRWLVGSRAFWDVFIDALGKCFQARGILVKYNRQYYLMKRSFAVNSC